MKNIKNTIAAMSLMAVMGLGAVSANAGILISDRGVNSTTPSCAKADEGLFDQLTGIIVVGLTGILLGDVAAPCTQPAEGVTNDGILVVG